MAFPFSWLLVAVALAAMATGGRLFVVFGREPELHKARLFLHFLGLHRLHLVSMAATWLTLLGFFVVTLAHGAPPLFPYGVVMVLLSVWAAFMSVAVILFVEGDAGPRD